MFKFIILFGNTTRLSQLEFSSLYPQFELQALGDNLFLFTSETDLAAEMMASLGGAIKIFQVLKELDPSIDDDEYLREATQLLAELDSEPEFTLTQAGKKQRSINNAQLKQELKAMGHKTRYFSSALTDSAVVLHHPEVIELLSVVSERLYFARTVAVQNIDDWTLRDREKPYADRRKGMLPPKVARMMVNIAIGQHPKHAEGLLYDPFCGTGTVLLEAAMRGVATYGSDLDQDAVKGSQANLTWLSETYQLPVKQRVFQMDATHLQEELFKEKVDLLVTEPFLGRQTPRDSELSNVFRGLEKMYLGALKAFTRILGDGAIVVMVFPLVTTDKREYNLFGLIDKLQAKGYNLVVDPLVYAREGARVARQIVVLRFDSSIK